ncbi:MAG: FAD-dependent oxidoreductase [Candidatus Helarchaeota archaeon]
MKVGIIGAGMSGLSIGYELVKIGFKVEVFEKDSIIGGLGAPWKENGYKIEKTYHAFFKKDTELLKLIDELNLQKKIIWFKSKIGILTNGKIKDFSTPLSILSNRMLSLFDILNFAKIYFKINKYTNWKELDNITTKDYIINTGNKSVYYKIFKPLLEIKWGSVFEEVSASWFWGRIVPRSKSRNKTLNSEKLGYLKEGGFSIITDKLGNIIQKNGKIHLNSKVQRVKYDENKKIYIIEYKDKNGKINEKEFNILVSTIPPDIILNIYKDLNKRSNNNRVKYQGIICLTMGLKERVTKFYQIPIHSNMNSFIGGIVEHTNFVPETYYNKEFILYAFSYLNPNSEFFNYSKEMLTTMYINELERLFPKKFKKENVNWVNVHVTKYATPIFTKQYSRYMPKIKSEKKGFYQVGLFNTYPVSDYNYIVKNAKNAAYQIKEDFEREIG